MKPDFLKKVRQSRHFDELTLEMMRVFRMGRKDASVAALSMLIRECILAAQMTELVA